MGGIEGCPEREDYGHQTQELQVLSKPVVCGVITFLIHYSNLLKLIVSISYNRVHFSPGAILEANDWETAFTSSGRDDAHLLRRNMQS